MWSWGYNTQGQLGDNSYTNVYTPIQVSNLTGVTNIAGGAYDAYAIKSNGTVWSWGANGWGELGNNSEMSSNTPVQVSNLSVSTQIIGIAINPTIETVTFDGTLQLTPTINPSTATNQTLKYSSNNTSIATVSPSGLITAVYPGTATITVTATDGSGCTATSVVTITAPSPPTNLTSSSITSTSATLKWTAVSQANSYKVYKNSVLIGSAASTTYTDTNLNTNTQYSYTVTALVGTAESLYSLPVEVTTQQSLASIQATGDVLQKIRVLLINTDRTQYYDQKTNSNLKLSTALITDQPDLNTAGPNLVIFKH